MPDHFAILPLINRQIPAYPSVTGLLHPITFRSISGFIGSLAWASLVLVALNGLGKLVSRLLHIQPFATSVSCSLGIAAAIAVGGLLNLAHGIYPASIFALLALGLAAFFTFFKRHPRQYSWLRFWADSPGPVRLALLVALLILIARVFATVRLGSFNITDDSSAYLVFPQKMLAAHCFAFDPFSDRRLLSSLGGAYFLQTIVIAGTSLGHIAMADRTFGLILLAPVLFDLGIAFGLAPYQIAAMELLASLVPQETFNLTFIVLPVAMLMSMMWLLMQIETAGEAFPWQLLLSFGSIGGAAIAMKSTYLPFVGALLIVSPLFTIRTKNWKWSLFSFVTALFGVLATLLAWAIAMKLNSGTYLFPVLGRGLDYSRYAHLSHNHSFVTVRFLMKLGTQGVLLLVLAGFLAILSPKSRRTKTAISFLVASAFAITAFNLESGGDYIWRYNFPQFFCSVIVFYAAAGECFVAFPRARRSSLVFYAGMASLASMFFYYDLSGKAPQPFRQFKIEREEYRRALRAGLEERPLESLGTEHEYHAIQSAIPDNGTSLENVAYPFLFNYKRNNIFVMDWPGAASPRPGWPYRSTAVELASYLRDNSIRYLIYGYKFAVWDDATNCRNLQTPRLFSVELDQLMQLSVAADGQLNELLSHYQSIYDDGRTAVIDLDRPIDLGGESVGKENQPIAIEAVCQIALSRYKANGIPGPH